MLRFIFQKRSVDCYTRNVKNGKRLLLFLPSALASDLRRHLLNKLLARLLSSCQHILAGEYSAPPYNLQASFTGAKGMALADTALVRTQSLPFHQAFS